MFLFSAIYSFCAFSSKSHDWVQSTLNQSSTFVFVRRFCTNIHSDVKLILHSTAESKKIQTAAEMFGLSRQPRRTQTCRGPKFPFPCYCLSWEKFSSSHIYEVNLYLCNFCEHHSSTSHTQQEEVWLLLYISPPTGSAVHLFRKWAVWTWQFNMDHNKKTASEMLTDKVH